ncbi:2'-5'-oligoadenylate synthase 1A-like [Ostrea edulis]|uniref:2'-5'-oligoadenylate synthase 1A-like n=1 Tax=Ostrea edulis TaxID=37623 RepID=UPI0024AF098D|nr:2'-5'-oligoadenylate synthase 1A-like [Ostrea edulis]XP_056016123.1 2'-5'-oligoadenylate synthase 1A-like [Ostrea edulis]XP_056016124.1 2'-5'-oligoadenylate synthase 1A-like [Ostrea edulis]
MVRRYSFRYRSQHPEMYPEVCGICKPQRRFSAPSHKAQHDEMKYRPIQQQRFYDHSMHLTHSGVFYPSSSSSVTTITASDLNTFVMKEIEPDTEYNKSCKEVVDQLCQFMQHDFPNELRPSEIIKGGSLGKGTAVKWKSDVDLVVFLVRFDSILELHQAIKDILDGMISSLNSKKDLTVERTNAHAVKVSLSCHAGHTHKVDILPRVNVLGTSVNLLRTETKRKIYTTMGAQSPSLREYYSAALAPLQISFVSDVPTKVKTLIRLVKYWRKTCFEESTRRKRLPSSYLLELITIGEWEDAGGSVNFDLMKGFLHVLLAIADYKRLKHAWNTNYDPKQYTRSYSCYVMDPANPFNNVMEPCDCWDLVESKARQFLHMSEFNGLSISSGWI